MNWKNVKTELPTRIGEEPSTERLVNWVVFKGEDLAQGRTCFTIYSFLSDEFMCVDNDIYKRLQKGTAEITHWDYINIPTP